MCSVSLQRENMLLIFFSLFCCCVFPKNQKNETKKCSWFKKKKNMNPPPSLCGDPQLLDSKFIQTKLSINKEENNKNSETTENNLPPLAEGEERDPGPILPHRKFHFVPSWLSSTTKTTNGLTLIIRAYISLCATDALALFNGEDHTGMMQWQGSCRCAQHIFDNFYPLSYPQECFAKISEIEQEKEKEKEKSSSSSETQKLIMSSFVKESFSDAQSLQEFQHVDTVLELGCGAGLLALVAAFSFKAKSIIFTDGNKECTDLAEINFELNSDRESEVLKANPPYFSSSSSSVIAKGKSFWWKKDMQGTEASEILFSHRNDLVTSLKSKDSIVIVGGDIVYDLDSVVPLVDTIHALASTFKDVRNSFCGGNDNNEQQKQLTFSRAHFFLCFFPRMWYVNDNYILLENVKDKLKAKGWKLLLEAGTGDRDGCLLHFCL
jgi:hypothetical protein